MTPKNNESWKKYYLALQEHKRLEDSGLPGVKEAYRKMIKLHKEWENN